MYGSKREENNNQRKCADKIIQFWSILYSLGHCYTVLVNIVLLEIARTFSSLLLSRSTIPLNKRNQVHFIALYRPDIQSLNSH